MRRWRPAAGRASAGRRATPGAASPVRALRLLDDVKTLVTVAENDIRVTALFDVTVVQGTTGTLTVRLPAGFTLTSFTGAPNEGADVVDGRLVLNVPAGRTRHQFLVALERPNAEAGSRRTVALPWLEGSQRETGDVAIEGVGALELAVVEAAPADAHRRRRAVGGADRAGAGAGAGRVSVPAARGGRRHAGVRRDALPGRGGARGGRRSRDGDDAGDAGGAFADRGVADGAQPGAAVPAGRAAGRRDAALGGSRRRRRQAGAGRRWPADPAAASGLPAARAVRRVVRLPPRRRAVRRQGRRQPHAGAGRSAGGVAGVGSAAAGSHGGVALRRHRLSARAPADGVGDGRRTPASRSRSAS